jgi:hypothetical protein
VASTVYDIEEIELQDGTVVTIRPLNIKRLRKFMDIMEKQNEAVSKRLEALREAAENGEELPDGHETEFDNLEFMIDMCSIAVEQSDSKLAADRERLEEALDTPTMWKIMEIAGGIKQDPNLQAGAGTPGII